MTAVTEDQKNVMRAGQLRSYPVAASTIIYLGTHVCLNASGYLVSAADTSGYRYAGKSAEYVDNSDGSDGDLYAEVYVSGEFESDMESALSVDDVGKRVYVKDNNTLGLSSDVTNHVFAGFVAEVNSAEDWIRIAPDFEKLETHLDGDSSKHDADEIDFEDGDGHLAATDVEAAIAELATKMVRVDVACPDVGGGGTDAALTAALKTLSGTALAKTGVFKILATKDEYEGGHDLSATCTFATATKGSILSSGAGYAVVKADSNGEFACTLANTADETVYVSAASSDGGHDANANGVLVTECVPDDATWSA